MGGTPSTFCCNAADEGNGYSPQLNDISRRFKILNANTDQQLSSDIINYH